MKARRVDQIEVEGRLMESKLAWKLAVYRESVLWRIVALIESVALNWNSDNIVGAYLSARALIEASALLLDLEQMYGTLDVETGTTSFSETKDIQRHRDAVLGATVLLLLDENCIDRLENEIERVAALQTA
jgi:hypothetical protein